MPLTEAEKQEYSNRIDRLEKGFTKLDRVVRGPDDVDTPGGLMYQVMMNSRFRKFLNGWLWLLTVIITGIVIEKLMSIMGGG